MISSKTKNKQTLRISEKDLFRLLSDNEKYRHRIDELSMINNELLSEINELKKQLAEKLTKFENILY